MTAVSEPVKVVRKGSGYAVVSGLRRLLAKLERGHREVEVEEVAG